MAMNYLTSNRGNLLFSGLDNFNASITNFTLPTITLGITEQSNPGVILKTPDTRIAYSELDVEFLVDEELKNYDLIYKWMLRITNTITSDDYMGDDIYRDATLVIHSSSNNPIRNIRYVDCYPISLSPIDFSEEDVESMQKKVTATFAFTYFDIEKIN